MPGNHQQRGEVPPYTYISKPGSSFQTPSPAKGPLLPWVRLGSAEQFPFFCSHDYAASQQRCNSQRSQIAVGNIETIEFLISRWPLHDIYNM